MNSVNSNRKPKKSQVNSHLDKPIKPQNSFFAFKQDISAELDKEHPNDSKQKLQEISSLRWDTLSDSGKKPYEDAYKQSFADYTDQLKEWNNLHNDDLNKVTVSPKKHYTRSTKKAMDMDDNTPSKRIIGIKKTKTSVKSKRNATQNKVEPPTDRKRSVSQRTKRGKSEGNKDPQEKIDVKSEPNLENEIEVQKQQIDVENDNNNLKNQYLKDSTRKEISSSSRKQSQFSSAKDKGNEQQMLVVEQSQTNLPQDSQKISKDQTRKSYIQFDAQLSSSNRNISNKRKSTFEIQSNLAVNSVNSSDAQVPDQKVDENSPLKSHKVSLERIPTIIDSSKTKTSSKKLQSQEGQVPTQRKSRNYLSQSSKKKPETRSSSKRNTSKSNEEINKTTSPSSPSRKQNVKSQQKKPSERSNSEKGRRESSYLNLTENLERNSRKLTTPKSSRNPSKNNEAEEQDQQKQSKTKSDPSSYSNKKQI